MEFQGWLSSDGKGPSDKRFFPFCISFYAITVPCLFFIVDVVRGDVKGHSSVLGFVPSEFFCITVFTFVMFEMLTSLASFTDKESSGYQS